MPNIPLGEWSGSDATKALHEIIRQYQEESNKQAAKMLAVTAQMLALIWAITALTVAMLIGLAARCACWAARHK